MQAARSVHQALAPASCEPEQAPAEERAGEVLLRDRDLASFPTVAEVVEMRDDDISDQRVQRQGCNERVEGRMCAGFVEGEKRGRKLVPCVRSVVLGACDASPDRPRPARPAAAARPEASCSCIAPTRSRSSSE